MHLEGGPARLVFSVPSERGQGMAGGTVSHHGTQTAWVSSSCQVQGRPLYLGWLLSPCKAPWRLELPPAPPYSEDASPQSRGATCLREGHTGPSGGPPWPQGSPRGHLVLGVTRPRLDISRDTTGRTNPHLAGGGQERCSAPPTPSRARAGTVCPSMSSAGSGSPYRRTHTRPQVEREQDRDGPPLWSLGRPRYSVR